MEKINVLEIVLQTVPYLFGAGGVAAYVFERRRNKAETKGVEADVDGKDIQNGKELISMYKDAMDDMTDRAKNKLEEVISMYDRKIKVLEEEIKIHKRIATSLKRENTSLRKQLKDAENNSTK